MSIRLALADDHPLVLDGLTHLFATEPDFEITARCTDGEQAIEAALQHTPDILVLDLRMPRKDGLAVIRELRQQRPSARIVLLTAGVHEDEVLEAIQLGVQGVVLKEAAPQMLVQCLRRVYAGGQWLESRSVSRALEKLLHREAGLQETSALLTPREIELVKLVAAGLSNREAARRLHITEGTVKVHLHKVYEKTEIRSRVALTLYAQDKGLV